MSNLINLTCIKCTPTQKKDGFITTLQNKDSNTIVTPFGSKTSSKQQTYYVKFDNQVQLNMTAQLDLDMFRIEEHSMDIPDAESPNGVKTIQCKWLHIK